MDEEEAEEGERKRMSRRRRRKEGEDEEADREDLWFLKRVHGDRATGANAAVRARNPRPLGGGAV